MAKKNEDEDNNDHLCSGPAKEDLSIEKQPMNKVAG